MYAFDLFEDKTIEKMFFWNYLITIWRKTPNSSIFIHSLLLLQFNFNLFEYFVDISLMCTIWIVESSLRMPLSNDDFMDYFRKPLKFSKSPFFKRRSHFYHWDKLSVRGKICKLKIVLVTFLHCGKVEEIRSLTHHPYKYAMSFAALRCCWITKSEVKMFVSILYCEMK